MMRFPAQLFSRVQTGMAVQTGMTRAGIKGMALLAVALMAACSPLKGDPQIAAPPDKVSMMMAESADRASTALQTLAAVEQARSPGIAVAPIDNAPPELMRAMTIAWNGPVEPMARKLADRAGYSFEAIGAPPPVSIVVNINVENTPVIDILRNVGLQLGVRADLKVDATSRMVEIHYAPVTGLGG
jgi:defect-in-organelle-trafficking protein DotD